MKATVKKAAGEASRTVPILAGVLLITIVLALLAFVHVSRQPRYPAPFVLRVA